MASTLDLTGYVLTYDDEFSSPTFKWSPDGFVGYQTTPYHGGRTLYGSNEDSMYVDTSIGTYNPFNVSNGTLQITAAPVPNPNNEPYSTGMATTEGLFSQQWGYFEIRAKIAEGPGMWSSFYLLSEDKAWPPEADFELFGAKTAGFGGGQDQFWTGEIAPQRDTQSAGLLVSVPGQNIYNDFHTYGISVQPDHVQWYFDGQLVNEVSTPAGFDKFMYMVLSLPVGGWAGQPAGETSAFTIDYIRAYSSNPNATPVNYQPISSPDGANTIPTGVITAKDVALTPTTITIQASEDHLSWWDATFIVTVDGVQVGGPLTTHAAHAAGEWQTVTLSANLRAIPHDVAITFVNDDDQGVNGNRNLYINSVAMNGVVIDNSSAALLTNGTVHFAQPGAGTSAPPPTPTPDPTPTPTPSGSGTLTLRVSEDAWNGNAQFLVAVDGQQIGGVQTAITSHAFNQWQDVNLTGTFDTGPHIVSVSFINDAWGGSATTDRNLYVQSVTIDGETIAGSSADLMANGTVSFHSIGATTPPPAPPPPSPPPSGTGLSVRVAEDAWNGDAQFTVSVDGVQTGGTHAVTASHAAGQWQDVAIDGTFASGPHTIAINFINDGWGGSAAADRNMYVQSVTINGETLPGAGATDTAANGMSDPASAPMFTNGTVTFHSTGAVGGGTGTGTGGSTTPPASALSTIVLHMSEDAWNGDAQFKLMVDGSQVGAVQTVTASHATGQVQDITVTGDFGAQGPNSVAVQFVNDGWGGSAATDRNLYVQSIDVNGHHFAGNLAVDNAANGSASADPTAAVMMINGTATFAVAHTAPPEIIG